jgi:poly[(R)-3-hydroxyalkanoate] polymerase subunit PhaC
MTDSGNSGGSSSPDVPGMQAASAPFEAWSKWFTSNMGDMWATPGASVPWLASPGISTGEEARAMPMPQGAMAGDPLLSAVEKLWDANPLNNVMPINWFEITRALQTLWAREMSDPARAVQRTMDYNQRLLEATTQVWTDAMNRFFGFEQQEEEGEQGALAEGDSRFSAQEWESNPFYQTLMQNYLIASEYLENEAKETADGKEGTEEQRRLNFYLRQFIEAMAPVNFLLTNPDATRRALETGGMSLVDGARNLLRDLEDGRLSMSDAEAFEVGENIATTPGKVVYRNELLELIQYEPKTEQVYETPILFIPPWINKYYIVDLSPDRSFVSYMLEQGYQLFMISWKNPDASMADTKFEDYITKGPLEANDVVRQITGADRVNPIGYCIGGVLLSMLLPYLEAGGDEEEKQKFGDPTFMVSLQDYSEVGETSVFMDDPQVEFMEMQMKERGYLDGRRMYNMFNLLQSRQLIWTNIVNNYLLGQDPPPVDMLYWNSDSTRQPREAHSFYIRNTYLENNLVEPGKVEIGGRPIDLGRITSDVYAVGAEHDHIVPWKSAWQISKLVGGNTHFTLASGGHIAGMMNPPGKEKGKYWTSDNAGQYENADEWFENAEEHEDTSWWEDFVAWLGQRSGEMVDPPRVGSDEYPPIENAPGTYVKET